MARDETTTAFARHEAMLRDGSYGGSEVLQDLALNLYNGKAWNVDMGRLARNADAKHWAIALQLLEAYRMHGEGDHAFLDLAADIAAKRGT